MKFSLKLFIAIFLISISILALAEVIMLRFVASKAAAEYVQRYQNLSKQIGDTLIEVDKTTDAMMLNALYTLREIDKHYGLPSDAELMKLKDDLGIGNLYIIDKAGKYIRSDWFITTANDPQLRAWYGGKPLSRSLFSYCEDYKNLIVGGSSIEKTPIIPSGLKLKVLDPNKFVMIPNHNRTRVLEASIEMRAIGDIIRKAMGSDANLLSIGLFTPNGDSLGYFDGKKPLFLRRTMDHASFDRPTASADSFVFFTQVKTVTGDCCECKVKGLTLPGGAYYYVLRTEVSRKSLNNQLATIRKLFLGIGLLGLLLSGLVAYFASGRLTEKLALMGDKVKKIADTNDWSVRLQMPGRDEISVLAERFDGMLERLKQSQSRLAAAESEKAFTELARQVAHDIRSPLTALDAMAGSMIDLPEQQRLIIRDAAGRIRDIANNLLEKYRGSVPDAQPGEPAGTYLLSGLIDSIISEKRLQFRSRPNFAINWAPNAASYGHFAKTEPGDFKRLLSNLINNSVEAIKDAGVVSVLLIGEGDGVRVEVRDNGEGIPEALLKSLGQRGQTHGKPGGSGLGLYHAKTCVERWGGSLKIESREGEGAVVAIMLPRAEAPPWFVSELQLPPKAVVVVLDDDPSIHHVWHQRFLSLGAKEHGIDVRDFLDPAELQKWAGAHSEIADRAIYLLDYELLGSGDTGLSLIEEMGLGSQAILVTSRFEEKAILDDCLRLGVRMIPKSLAGFVPLAVVEPGSALDAVLIDDDLLVHKVWQMAAKAHGKNLKVFSSHQGFLETAGGLDKNTLIYVDSNLKAGIRGQDFAKKLHERGFTNLCLCTGYAPEAFSDMPWIKKVVGKEAPWI